MKHVIIDTGESIHLGLEPRPLTNQAVVIMEYQGNRIERPIGGDYIEIAKEAYSRRDYEVLGALMDGVM
jgi:hypothetical protein